MWQQESFCSCPKLLALEICLLMANTTDLGFGEELSLLPHGKVSKCFSIAINVKSSLESAPPSITQAFCFLVGVSKP